MPSTQRTTVNESITMTVLLMAIGFAGAGCSSNDDFDGQTGGAGVPPGTLTDAQLDALTPEELSDRLIPLRRVADAVHAIGTTMATDVYSGVALDAKTETVNVYLTDESRWADIRVAAGVFDPAADFGLARTHVGLHARAELLDARDRIVAAQEQLPFKLRSAGVPADGSGLELGVDDVGKADRAMNEPMTGAIGSVRAGGLTLAGMAGVPIALSPAEPVQGWSRFMDSPRWIAGEFIQDGHHACTSGIPAQRTTDGHPILVTAAHCFPNGASVFTGAVGGVANRIGTVVARSTMFDAIAIDTSATGLTAPQEWDGKNTASFVLGLSATDQAHQQSHIGDSVCQDGYPSGVVCGIKVTNVDILFMDTTGATHRGAIGQVASGSPGQEGDSGGLVFAIAGSSNNPRQPRGIVSGGVVSNSRAIAWTEVFDIFISLKLRLAP